MAVMENLISAVQKSQESQDPRWGGIIIIIIIAQSASFGVVNARPRSARWVVKREECLFGLGNGGEVGAAIKNSSELARSLRKTSRPHQTTTRQCANPRDESKNPSDVRTRSGVRDCHIGNGTLSGQTAEW